MAPANLNVQPRVVDVQPKFSITENSIDKLTPNFSTRPISQATFASSNVFGNRNDNKKFADSTEEKTPGACALSVPPWKGLHTENNSNNATAQNPLLKGLTFGSNATFGSSNPMSFRFMSQYSSNTTSTFDPEAIANGLAAVPPTSSASPSQNINLFEPTTKYRTSKPFIKFKSPASTNAIKKCNANLSSSSFSGDLRNAKFNWPTDSSLSNSPPTPLGAYFASLKKSTLGGSATNDPVVQDISATATNETANNVVAKLEKVGPEKEDS